MPDIIDLTPIIQALIGLLAALITYKLIPLIKSKTNKEQQAMLEATVRTLVFAAEQIYGSGAGANKLKYVQAQLQARGFDLDMAAIEAAVYAMAHSTGAPATNASNDGPDTGNAPND